MSVPRYEARIAPLDEAWAGPWWNGEAPSPFQTRAWLASWYRAFAADGAAEPLFVEVREAIGGAGVYALPLIRQREPGGQTISFADLGVTDYNLPLLGPAPPADDAAARAAWQAVSRALPQCDILGLRKMPAMAGNRPNPLVAALGGHVAPLSASAVETGDNLEDWRAALDRHHRKELGRFWRVFTKRPDARFLRARNQEDASRLFDWLEAMQSRRAGEMGLGADEYLLDRPVYAGLYRERLAQGLADGSVILTALVCGEQIVAVLYGLAAGRHYAMVRITSAGGEWANCSPGRLIIDRSIEHLHAEGFRTFDFTTGDYGYKRCFEGRTIPLYEVTLARSLRGLPNAGLFRTKAFVRANPRLAAFARRIVSFGKRESRIESKSA